MADQKQKVLIIGAGGGREHAIGWKIAQSLRAGEIFFAPGNAGTAQIGTNVNIVSTDIPKLTDYAEKGNFDLVLVVADDPLALGMVDALKIKKFAYGGRLKPPQSWNGPKLLRKNLC